jgi:DNA-binding NarL/FixJ family response regulator
MQNDLSELEIAIVRALAQGLQSKEIANALDCNRTAIEFRIRTLFIKLEARSRAQLVARGYDLGVLPAAPSYVPFEYQQPAVV